MRRNPGRWWKISAALPGCLCVCLIARAAQGGPPNPGTTGAPTQEVAAVDPAVYDDYVGHYKFSDTTVMTVSRDGTHLLTRMTGQPQAVEIFPSSRTEYFAKLVNARLTFETDAQGHVTALTLHQNGKDHTAPRIDAQQAKQIEDALNARVQSQTPLPGSEAAVRRLFAGLLAGTPNYDEMAPDFADLTRQQVGPLQRAAQQFGPVQSMEFRGVTPQGADSYEVHHEHGTSNVMIMLSPDGKITGAGFGPGRGMTPPPPPVVGAPAEAGPYRATSDRAFGAPGLKTFLPGSLDAFPRRDTLPVVIWANGGCNVDAPVYMSFLSTIASHGFLVITTADPPEGGPPGRQTTAKDLTAAIDWAQRENSRAGSPLKGKIETKRVAVMGQSCGGGLAIELGADPRVATIGVFNYGTTEDVLKKTHGPVLLINGHEQDFMMQASKATYEAIDRLPAFYGAMHGAGHVGTVTQPGGGEFADVASNWALWQLKGDRKASAMFVGPQCSLCTNSNWDVQSKRLATR
jgi:dienelactone hydrolase